jgi:hypothetical protein
MQSTGAQIINLSAQKILLTYHILGRNSKTGHFVQPNVNQLDTETRLVNQPRPLIMSMSLVNHSKLPDNKLIFRNQANGALASAAGICSLFAEYRMKMK